MEILIVLAVALVVFLLGWAIDRRVRIAGLVAIAVLAVGVLFTLIV